MYIKEVILEGFKSYAQRTVISGFDPQFNAITGYNGSGKSNILDGICFVLGLSTLSLVRASSLQELIYKYGHAGIIKATVSIVFDNSNKKTSPSGLEACDVIIVTRVIQSGKSKYYLNGRNVTNIKVKNMFKSIQLNIDNPHFLVAQGRITKAINLKPMELIGMIEETSGTSLYEQKRKDSRKLMEKKEHKLTGVTEMLRDDIEPRMQRMKKEREQYNKWKAGESQLDTLEKFLSANEYYQQRKDLEGLHMDRTNNEFTKKELTNKLATIEERIKTALKEIEDAEAQMSSEASFRYKALKSEVRAKKKEISTLESEVRNLERNIKDSEKEMDKREKEITELDSAISRADQKILYLDSTIQRQSGIYEEKRELYFKNGRQMDAVRKGDRTVEDELNSRLGTAELNMADVNTEIKKREAQRLHLQQELEKFKRSNQMTQEEQKKVEKEIKVLADKVEYMRKQIEEFEFITSNEDYQDVQDQMRMHFEIMNNMNLKLNQMIANNPDFKLSYRDPEPGFDRKKVRGRIFQLFSISDPGFIKALEAIAGGRLFNIVVDNEQTSKMLLSKRCFGQASVVLIPNEKIIPNTLPEEAVLKARKIASDLNGQAVPACSVLKFDPELKNSLEYVFGGTFICSSSEIAQKIAFDQKIRRRCVNLEGDIFDPSGTLTGGYQNMNRSTLTRYAEYKRTLEEYEKKRIKIKELEQLQAEYKKKVDTHNEIKSEYDIAFHKLTLMEKQVREISQARLKEKAEATEMELKDVNQQLSELREQHRSLQRELDELREERSSVTQGQKDIMDVLKEQSERLKKELDKMQGELKKLKVERSTLEVERDQNKTEVKRKRRAVQDEISNSKKLKRNLEKCTKELENSREYYYKIEEEKRDLDKVFSQLEAQMAQNEIELEKLEKENNNLDRELKRVLINIENIGKDIRECEKHLRQMENENPWFLKELEKFGLPGSEYDFDNADIEFEKKRYEHLKKEQESLAKRINLQVESICEKLNNEYNALIRRRTILETDRNTIEQNIDELDKKRQESIQSCVQEVNKHFKEIFSTFLPGTSAKLLPLNEHDFAEGLEIKVAFSGIWKVGLSELSGGQRSLLALSFLLALLLYQPAPFYILDEIDAALDLSHTENIGEMIMKHFPQSQFIIISLKEEFYSKANVLFQTSVVHGVSKVERIVLATNPLPSKKKAVEKMIKSYIQQPIEEEPQPDIEVDVEIEEGEEPEEEPEESSESSESSSDNFEAPTITIRPELMDEPPARRLRERRGRALPPPRERKVQEEREYGAADDFRPTQQLESPGNHGVELEEEEIREPEVELDPVVEAEERESRPDTESEAEEDKESDSSQYVREPEQEEQRPESPKQTQREESEGEEDEPEREEPPTQPIEPIHNIRYEQDPREPEEEEEGQEEEEEEEDDQEEYSLRKAQRGSSYPEEGPTQMIDEEPFRATQEIIPATQEIFQATLEIQEIQYEKRVQDDFGATQLVDEEDNRAIDYQQTQAIDEDEEYK